MGAEAAADPRGVTMAVTMAVTIPARSCPICRAPFTPAGRRRYCSAACRQRAYLWRRAQAQSAPAPLARPSGAASVYECPACPACGSRYLDEQRCPECNLFCRRIGLGGPCPHCDEPVAAADLLDPAR